MNFCFDIICEETLFSIKQMTVLELNLQKCWQWYSNIKNYYKGVFGPESNKVKCDFRVSVQSIWPPTRL